MWQGCPYPPIPAARWSPRSCKSTCWGKRYSWRTTVGRRNRPYQHLSRSVVLTAVHAAISLDLQRGVLDLKATLKIRRERVQERIFGAPVGDDQVRGQGSAGGGERPDV